MVKFSTVSVYRNRAAQLAYKPLAVLFACQFRPQAQDMACGLVRSTFSQASTLGSSMTSQNKEAPVNRTFKLEGWMPIALFVALLLIGILAALILPNFIDAP